MCYFGLAYSPDRVASLILLNATEQEYLSNSSPLNRFMQLSSLFLVFSCNIQMCLFAFAISRKEQIMGAELARLQGEIQKVTGQLAASDNQLRKTEEMRHEYEARIKNYEAKISQMDSTTVSLLYFQQNATERLTVSVCVCASHFRSAFHEGCHRGLCLSDHDFKSPFQVQLSRYSFLPIPSVHPCKYLDNIHADCLLLGILDFQIGNF